MLLVLLVLLLAGESLSWRVSSGLGTRLLSLRAASTADRSTVIHTVKLRFRGEERIVSIPEGKTVLEAAEEIWDDAPCSCRSGVCVECAGKVIAGRDSVLEEDTGLEESVASEGFICTCQTRIMGNDAVIELGKYEECNERQYGSCGSPR